MDGRAPVIAHVGAADTATSIDLARDAAAAGSSAVSAVVPFYYPHAPGQIRAHFLDIAEGSPLPFLPYYFPTGTSNQAPFKLFIELAEHENIVGLNTPHVTYSSFSRWSNSVVIKCRYSNGADEVCVHGLLSGAPGAIGSTYNFMASQFVRLTDRLEAGDVHEALRLQAAANAVIREGAPYDNVAFARAILQVQGFDVGPPRKPLQQLLTDDHSLIAKLVSRTAFLR